MKTLCLRCHVAGRVQGVGFRYATAEKALGLGVSGYVRNLPDRRVEVLACGEESAVIALRNWLWQFIARPCPCKTSTASELSEGILILHQT